MIALDNNLGMDDFGETVTYRPAHGRPRSIRAIVDRDAPSMFGDVGVTPTIRVTVANDSATGISSRNVRTGSDQIDVSERSGEAAVSRKITRIVSHDEGMMVLEVR
jgi:hypothetical protein